MDTALLRLSFEQLKNGMDHELGEAYTLRDRRHDIIIDESMYTY